MKYVAFLDILGFKEMVENSTHEKLERVYNNLLFTSASLAVSGGKFKTINTESGQTAIADLSGSSVACLIVSDSVIFWTEDVSMQSFINICAATGKLLVTGMFTGLPMRGGISMGDLTHLSSSLEGSKPFEIRSLFGNGLVRAYMEEGIYNWAGCVIADTCIEHYDSIAKQFVGQISDLATLDYLLDTKFLVRYPVPQKQAGTSIRWVVNWTIFNRSEINEDVVRKSFTMHGKTASNPSVEKKLENTIDFLRFSKRKLVE